METSINIFEYRQRKLLNCIHEKTKGVATKSLPLLFFGAEGRSRTDMGLPPQDFTSQDFLEHDKTIFLYKAVLKSNGREIHRLETQELITF